MIIEEKLLEMRGMKRQEIMDYFRSLGLLDDNLSIFRAKDWSVQVSEESIISIGSLRIPSTTVQFFGKEKCLEEVMYRFRLRFLTAGG